MINPNKINSESVDDRGNGNNNSYNNIENVLASITPDPQTFKGTIYPSSEVDSDSKLLAATQKTPTYKKNAERSDAKVLEKTFIESVELDDWFGEYELYGNDPDYRPLNATPTTDIDDSFNHIDMIGVINNEITNHEAVPFAIDLTYNTDSEKLSQKFRWKHVREKSVNAPEGVSEFGESYLDKDRTGGDILRTRPLPFKFRQGLKIPGFASAKYYEDMNNFFEPMHEKGRIDVMPRFIVGYSPELADILADGRPTKEYMQKYGEKSYKQKDERFKHAERCARWCTLVECQQQAADIQSMLDQMSAEETKWMQPEELEKAKKQIATMHAYFTKALELAAKQAESSDEEKMAMKYADRDVVCQAILRHSSSTYVFKTNVASRKPSEGQTHENMNSEVSQSVRQAIGHKTIEILE